MIIGMSPASITAWTCCWLPAVMLDKNQTASCTQGRQELDTEVSQYVQRPDIQTISTQPKPNPVNVPPGLHCTKLKVKPAAAGRKEATSQTLLIFSFGCVSRLGKCERTSQLRTTCVCSSVPVTMLPTALRAAVCNSGKEGVS